MLNPDFKAHMCLQNVDLVLGATEKKEEKERTLSMTPDRHIFNTRNIACEIVTLCCGFKICKGGPPNVLNIYWMGGPEFSTTTRRQRIAGVRLQNGVLTFGTLSHS